MSKGYLMVATGTDYINQAILCAKTIKKTQTLNNVSVMTDQPSEIKDKNLFDEIITIPAQDNNKTEFYRTDIRWKTFHETPYEETVVLDTDMIFLTDVSEWWKYLKYYDVCFTKNVRTYRNNIITQDYYRKTFVENKMPNIYCAFHYFKKSQTALDYYLKLKQVCRNYKEYYKLYLPKQTPAVSSMDINHAITVLEQDLDNYFFEPASFVHMKSHVQEWENCSSSWLDTIPFYFNKNIELKIGNYLQHGIFHYTENSFCNKIGKYFE